MKFLLDNTFVLSKNSSVPKLPISYRAIASSRCYLTSLEIPMNSKIAVLLENSKSKNFDKYGLGFLFTNYIIYQQ